MIARRLAALEPLVVALIAPVLLFPSPRRLSAVAVVLMVWICQRWQTGRWVPATPFNLCLALLLAMTGVSLWATPDVTRSLGKVSGVVLGVIVFWTGVRAVTTSRRLAIAVALFVAAGAGLAIAGVLGTNWFVKFPLLAGVLERLPRVVRGIPGAEDGFNPNAVAGCLLLFIPLQLALWTPTLRGWLAAGLGIRDGRLLRLALAASLALTTGTLVLTQSRGAIGGLALAGLAALAWSGRRGRRVAAAIVAAGALATIALGPSRTADLVISRSGPQMAHNVSGRVELWSRAIDAIQDVPITGMGMNVFRWALPRVYPTYLTSPTLDVAHAHNHLLQAALDLGVPGLVAYLAIWIVAAGVLIDRYRHTRVTWVRGLAGALGAGLVAHFVFSLTDAIPLGAKVGVLFWMALTLVASLASAGAGQGEQ